VRFPVVHVRLVRASIDMKVVVHLDNDFSSHYDPLIISNIFSIFESGSSGRQKIQ